MPWTMRIYNAANVQQASVNIPDNALPHLNNVWGGPQPALVFAGQALRQRTQEVEAQQTKTAGDLETQGEVQTTVTTFNTDWPET